MTNTKDQITTMQAIAFIANYMTAMGILSLPRGITSLSQSPDGWITLLLSGLMVMLFGIIIIKLCQRFPQKTIYQFSQEIIGKWLGILLSFFLILYFLLLGAFEVRGMAEVTHLYLLPRTPFMATIIPFICLGVYLVMGGINSIARFLVILLPATFIIFTLVTLLSLKSFELNHLRPILGFGVWPVIKGIKATLLAMAGVEVMLVFVAYMEKPHKAIQATLMGVSISLFLYIILTVFTIASLGVAGVQTKAFPVISLFRQFELTGILFERFETFILAIWITQIFTTFVICYYLAVLGFAQLFQKKTEPFVFALAPFLYLIAFAPKNLNDVFHFGDFIGYFGFIFVSLVPIVLLLISLIRGKKHAPIS